jgi:hypothetical protein
MAALRDLITPPSLIAAESTKVRLVRLREVGTPDGHGAVATQQRVATAPLGPGLMRLAGGERVNALGDDHEHAVAGHERRLDDDEDGQRFDLLKGQGQHDRELQDAAEVEGEIAAGLRDQRLVGAVPVVLVGDAVRDDGYVPDHVDEGLDEPEGLTDDQVAEGGGRDGARWPSRKRVLPVRKLCRVFDAISQYALERLAGFVGKRINAASAGVCGW